MSSSRFSLDRMLGLIQKLATPGRVKGLVTLSVANLTEASVEHAFRIVEAAHDPNGASLRIVSGEGDVLVDAEQGLRVNPKTIGSIVMLRNVLFAKVGENIGISVIEPN